MTGLTCTAVRRRLAEFHDGELPVQKRIEIHGHLNECDGCIGELRGYESVSSALRLAAAPGPADVRCLITGQASVFSRLLSVPNPK